MRWIIDYFKRRHERQQERKALLLCLQICNENERAIQTAFAKLAKLAQMYQESQQPDTKE